MIRLAGPTLVPAAALGLPSSSQLLPAPRPPLPSVALLLVLTPYPRRGFPRAPSPPRGTFRPPLWASGEDPGGSRGCPRTARARTRWPGVARDKALNFLSRPEPIEGRPRRRLKKPLTNAKHGSQFARSRSRAGFQLGLGSIHQARGPGAEARHRRRSLFVEPDPRGEAPMSR